MYSLLVANIPYDCNSDEFRQWLEAAGVRVVNLKFITDLVSGTSPSFAQVHLFNSKDADHVAKSLDGCRMKNSVLRVKVLRFKDTSSQPAILKSKGTAA